MICLHFRSLMNDLAYNFVFSFTRLRIVPRPLVIELNYIDNNNLNSIVFDMDYHSFLNKIKIHIFLIHREKYRLQCRFPFNQIIQLSYMQLSGVVYCRQQFYWPTRLDKQLWILEISLWYEPSRCPCMQPLWQSVHTHIYIYEEMNDTIIIQQ